MAIGVIHLLFGVVFGRQRLAAIARDGFWNAVDPHPDRQLAVWFIAFAFPAILAGALIARMGARGERPPRWLGFSVLVFTLVLGVLMPISGGWLLLVPSILLILAARRGTASREVWRDGDLWISTDPGKLDRARIHEFLRSSYWAKDIPREVVDRSLDHALCFGVYDRDRLVGFARVITDRATFAYVSDVFVLESHRGRGLSKRLMEAILAHGELQGLRRWMLATDDAHGLYAKYGFETPARAERLMERVFHDPYPKPPA